jgi:hypothetical protein
MMAPIAARTKPDVCSQPMPLVGNPVVTAVAI